MSFYCSIEILKILLAGRGQPPPAHVSTPFSVLNHGAVSGSPPQHVVQHHPAPAPAPASLAGYPGSVSRPLPLSPGPRSRIRGGPGAASFVTATCNKIFSFHNKYFSFS